MNAEGLPTMEQILSEEQQRALADRLSALMSAGYGELTIVVRAGKVRFLRLVTSQQDRLAESDEGDIIGAEGEP